MQDARARRSFRNHENVIDRTPQRRGATERQPSDGCLRRGKRTLRAQAGALCFGSGFSDVVRACAGKGLVPGRRQRRLIQAATFIFFSNSSYAEMASAAYISDGPPPM